MSQRDPKASKTNNEKGTKDGKNSFHHTKNTSFVRFQNTDNGDVFVDLHKIEYERNQIYDFFGSNFVTEDLKAIDIAKYLHQKNHNTLQILNEAKQLSSFLNKDTVTDKFNLLNSVILLHEKKYDVNRILDDSKTLCNYLNWEMNFEKISALKITLMLYAKGLDLSHIMNPFVKLPKLQESDPVVSNQLLIKMVSQMSSNFPLQRKEAPQERAKEPIVPSKKMESKKRKKCQNQLELNP